jgi:hypothetical protein
MSESYNNYLNQHVIYTTRVKHLEELENKVYGRKSKDEVSNHILEGYMKTIEDLTQQVIRAELKNQSLLNDIGLMRVRFRV